MSARSRAIVKSFHDPGEIPRFFASLGKGVPTWLNKSFEQNQPLFDAYRAIGHPDQGGYLYGIAKLLREVELQEPERQRVLKAKDLFERYGDGFLAYLDLPTNSPKPRKYLLELFNEAVELWLPIEKTWLNWGDTPLNLGMEY